MEFETDPMQDGRFRLARKVKITEAPPRAEQEQGTMLVLSVVGMAGAIVFSMILGGGRTADDNRPPLGWASPGKMVSFDAVPHGLEAHAYRPWPNDMQAVPQDSVLYGGKAFVQNLDMVGMTRSFPLLATLAEGEYETLWAHLEKLYRQDFEPALSPEDYAERERRAGALAAYERVKDGAVLESEAVVYPDTEAPPHGGPRKWITCPECDSSDEASDTPCTNLACPSHSRRGTLVEERTEAELIDAPESGAAGA